MWIKGPLNYKEDKMFSGRKGKDGKPLPKFTREGKEATFGAIRHWSGILYNEEECEGPNNCPLCAIYYPTNCEPTGPDCEGCPILLFGKEVMKSNTFLCQNTPYQTLWKGYVGSAITPKLKDAAEKELLFLNQVALWYTDQLEKQEREERREEEELRNAITLKEVRAGELVKLKSELKWGLTELLAGLLEHPKETSWQVIMCHPFSAEIRVSLDGLLPRRTEYREQLSALLRELKPLVDSYFYFKDCQSKKLQRGRHVANIITLNPGMVSNIVHLYTELKDGLDKEY
jgi:hypothetical protein